MLAPPWIPVPAPGYGGIEEVVRLLCDGLVANGHDVTLFAAPGSDSTADVHTLLKDCHPDEIERSCWEVDHVARGFAQVDAAVRAGRPYDVVHDHCGCAAIAMADRLQTPIVHTLHGPFDDPCRDFYATHAHKATIVAISHSQLEAAPPELRDAAVVHNPLRFAEWQLEERPGDHVLWIGRMAPIKGPHRAIAAARDAGMPLVLAGPVQPGQEEFFAAEVEPHIDGEHVIYAGELGGEEKQAAYRAAWAMLMPIRWAEPFGMVIAESMACGTPVIAYREGAARELIVDGVNGFLVDDEHEMAVAIARVGAIDRRRCRANAEARFDVSTVVSAYERIYERARNHTLRHAEGREHWRPGARWGPPPRAPRAARI
ncbi:MAG: glycosyltransferase family 4 protein [Solirubrobacterales bacterium]|nr:glycosyltransferase family 4 protein [Solirubrobacterales bacterium]